MASDPDEKVPGQSVNDLGFVHPREDAAIADRNLSRLYGLQSVFCSPKDLQVDICDATAATGSIWSTFRDDKQLQKHIRASNPDTRIISIVSKNSIQPLKITKSSAEAIFTRYAIGPEIADIFCPFGRKPKNSEAGLGSMKVKHKADGSCDMQYLLIYIEETEKDDKWAIRQVGVFHRFVPGGPGSLWIFLHAYPNTRVMECVRAAIPHQPHWSFMHLLVLSTCLENWRWHLRDLNDVFENFSNIVLTTDFNNYTGDVSKELIVKLTPLQNLEDKALSLTVRLRSSLATIRKLGETSKKLYDRGDFACGGMDFQRVCDETNNLESELEGHLQNVKLLQKRARETLGLLSVALNLQNQAMVVNINQSILHLTESTVDDSVTVRVITIVTLVYLPASFVTSFLGMNLFTFQNPSGGSGFAISRQFWVFIVLVVPLTVLTLGLWYWFSKRKSSKKRDLEAATATAIEQLDAGVQMRTGSFIKFLNQIPIRNRRRLTGDS
ncbi:MAG: hypothetical protein M1813_004107 [Trichoglossum hirsutum]|nr:MAG: hypothetical protein M1813_004107 [Trichoglossum hirsutum]